MMAGGFFRLFLSIVLFVAVVVIWPPALLIYIFVIMPLALIFRK